MKRSRKSKGVSWAHGVNLCQTKLFSSEDCPSKVGLNSQDHLQAKASGMLHPHAVEFNDCPPGFEVTHFGNQSKDFSRIPLIKWKLPPKFVMSCIWCVAAGEESKEVESQKLREMRVLEAVYPRASAIPPGATVSVDIEDERYDDSLTPLVPMIPIEEDEYGDIESDLAAVGNFPTSSLPMMASNIHLAPAIPKSTIETSASEVPTSAKLPDVGADVAAAASTALAVLMKSKEQGSMIDTDLLIKILSDPTMIQNLATCPQTHTDSGSQPIAATMAPVSVTLTKPVNETVPLDTTQKKAPKGNLSQFSTGGSLTVTSLPQMGAVAASGVKPASVSGPLPAPDLTKVNISIPNTGSYSKIGSIPVQPNITPVSSVRNAQPCKDINYYKNLVRQHGEQKGNKEQNLGENGNNGNHLHDLNMVHNMKGENLKLKNQKPCMYFNSPKGCRNGVNCPYTHDMSLNWRTGNIFENQSAKRMKLCGENTGRT